MKTNKSTKVLCVIAMLGCASGIMAQEEVNKEEKNLNREMTLEREYDPSVQDANKVNTLPAVKEPTVKKRAIDYAVFAVPTEPEKQISVLPSGKIMADMDYNKRRGYLNLAAGMNLNINGDFGYHILSTEKDNLNVYLSHRSTNGNIDYIQIDDKVKAKLNDNLGGLNYKHKFEKAVFNIGAKYGYSGFNYYGLPVTGNLEEAGTNLDLADRTTNQVNQTIGANIGIESEDEEAPFGYMVDFDYINFSHKYGADAKSDGPTENTFELKFNLFAPFGGNQRIGLAGLAEYFSYNLPERCSFENHAEVILNPYYTIEGDIWNLKLGAKAMIVTGENSKFAASPDIAFDVEVADKTVFYLKADGKLYSNSMYETALVNRYVNPTEELMPSRNWLDANLGIKSGVVPGFWFDVFAGYKITSSDVLYLPSRVFEQDGFGNFAEAMSDINTKRFFAGVNLKYNYQKLFEINLKGVYNNWKANYGDSWIGGEANAELDRVWGKPTAEINAGVTVRPIDKLAVDVNYYLATGRYTQLGGYEEVNLNNINELNIRGMYNINKTFSVNVQLNNVLFQKYDIYYGYPAQGFNLMGGINVNF